MKNSYTEATEIYARRLGCSRRNSPECHADTNISLKFLPKKLNHKVDFYQDCCGLLAAFTPHVRNGIGADTPDADGNNLLEARKLTLHEAGESKHGPMDGAADLETCIIRIDPMRDNKRETKQKQLTPNYKTWPLIRKWDMKPELIEGNEMFKILGDETTNMETTELNSTSYQEENPASKRCNRLEIGKNVGHIKWKESCKDSTNLFCTSFTDVTECNRTNKYIYFKPIKESWNVSPEIPEEHGTGIMNSEHRNRRHAQIQAMALQEDICCSQSACGEINDRGIKRTMPLPCRSDPCFPDEAQPRCQLNETCFHITSKERTFSHPHDPYSQSVSKDSLPVLLGDGEEFTQKHSCSESSNPKLHQPYSSNHLDQEEAAAEDDPHTQLLLEDRPSTWPISGSLDFQLSKEPGVQQSLFHDKQIFFSNTGDLESSSSLFSDSFRQEKKGVEQSCFPFHSGDGPTQPVYYSADIGDHADNMVESGVGLTSNSIRPVYRKELVPQIRKDRGGHSHWKRNPAAQPQKQKDVEAVVEVLSCYNGEPPKLDDQLDKTERCTVLLGINSLHQRRPGNCSTSPDDGTVVLRENALIPSSQSEVKVGKNSCSNLRFDLPAVNSLAQVFEIEYSVENWKNSQKDFKANKEYRTLISSEEVGDTINPSGHSHSPKPLNHLTAKELKRLSTIELVSVIKPSIHGDLISSPFLHRIMSENGRRTWHCSQPILNESSGPQPNQKCQIFPLSPSLSTSLQNLSTQSRFHTGSYKGMVGSPLRPDSPKPHGQRLILHRKSFPCSHSTRTGSICVNLLTPSVTVVGLTHLPDRPKTLKSLVSPLPPSFNLLNGTRSRTDGQSQICLFDTGSSNHLEVR